MLTLVKEEFRKRSQVFLSILHSLGLRPNHLTLIGFFLAILSSISYSMGRADRPFILLGGMLLLLSGLCDALDGALAELYGQTTVFGGILDSTLDRIEEAIVISSIMLAGLCSLGVGLAALVSSFAVSYVRSRAEVEGIDTVNIGIAERAERVLILVFASLFQVVDIGIAVIAIISSITVVQRLVHVAQVRDTPRIERQARTL